MTGTLTEAELRHALDQQIDYTGQLQREVDRLNLKCDDYRSEIAMREDREAELECVIRAVRKMVTGAL